MSKIKAVYNFKCRQRYVEKIGSKTADKVAEKETIHVIHRVPDAHTSMSNRPRG